MMYADLLADMDDDPEAEGRLADAAAAGYPPAQHLMAALRGEPDGFDDLDPEVAREFVEDELKEAWRGDPEAQNNLAVCYASGDGGGRDDEEAVRWFRRAAEAGSEAAESGLSAAQNEVGLMYIHGRGVERDPAEAVKWFRASETDLNPESLGDACPLPVSSRLYIM